MVEYMLLADSVPASPLTPSPQERSAHFFEFTGEMANSAWAFVFALSIFLKLSKTQADHNARLKHG
jgi:hypothetical protein